MSARALILYRKYTPKNDENELKRKAAEIHKKSC